MWIAGGNYQYLAKSRKVYYTMQYISEVVLIMEPGILNSKKIIETIELLNLRIEDRFPGSGLGKVGKKLYNIGNKTDKIIAWVEKPNPWYRTIVGIFIFMVSIGLIYALSSLEIELYQFNLASFAQITEPLVNEIVFLGAAIIFLVSIETRAKRKKIINSINRLRSIAHVIDAHQLTKDPYSIAQPDQNTEHSPIRKLTQYELNRYLDYCTEMLALTGKLGFLYVQKFDDPVSMNAVTELEKLTTDLSRKIWQKIMITKKLEVK